MINIPKFLTRLFSKPKQNNSYYGNYSNVNALVEQLNETNDFNYDINEIYCLINDSKLHEGFNIITSTLSKQNYSIKWGEDVKGKDEHIDFIIKNFKKLKIKKIIKEIIQSLILGYSLQEIVYKVEDSKILIDNIVCVPRITLNTGIKNFVFDDYDNLIGFKQDNQINSAYGDNDYLPLEKCIYYGYENVDGNYLGNPITKYVTKELRLRKQIESNIGLIVWRYAVPIITMGVEKDFEDISAVQRQLGDILDGKSPGLIMDTDNTADILVDKNNHAYLVDLLNYLDNVILSNLFNTDSKASGKDTASSLQIQRESTYNQLNDVVGDINDLFNEVIKNLLDYNFNDIEIYPIFVLSDIKIHQIENLLYLLNSLQIEKNTETFKNIVKEGVTDMSSVHVDLDDLEFALNDPKMSDENPSNPQSENKNRGNDVGVGAETSKLDSKRGKTHE
jgi:hypothetical protein